MNLSEMSSRVPEEWMEQMEDFETQLTPGIPLATQIETLMANRQLTNNLIEKLGNVGIAGQQLEEMAGRLGSMAVDQGGLQPAA